MIKRGCLVMFSILSAFLSVTGSNAESQSQPEAHKTQNVIVVMIDGMRWQEIFRGVDPQLIKTHGPEALGAPKERAAYGEQAYARATPSESRAALMPFLWSTVAVHGQLFGNRDLGSDSHVTNGFDF